MQTTASARVAFATLVAITVVTQSACIDYSPEVGGLAHPDPTCPDDAGDAGCGDDAGYYSDYP